MAATPDTFWQHALVMDQGAQYSHPNKYNNSLLNTKKEHNILQGENQQKI